MVTVNVAGTLHSDADAYLKDTFVALADDLANLPSKPSRLCLTGQWLSQQSERDVEAFNEFLASGGHKSTLYKRCVKYGLDAGLTQMKDHCARTCLCYRGVRA